MSKSPEKSYKQADRYRSIGIIIGKGRNIATNVRLIQDVIEKFNEDETEGAIIFLDVKKAFDSVSYTFLNEVLNKFTFGSSFIKWINTIDNNAESCIINNGWTSRPSPIQKGMRQGCPLLFLLVVEILAINLRKTPEEGLDIKVME